MYLCVSLNQNAMLHEYLTQKELAEAVQVMEQNKSAWIDFCDACNFTPSVEQIIGWLATYNGIIWMCRYENSKLIRNTVNQINSTTPQAVSCKGWDCGVTKTK